MHPLFDLHADGKLGCKLCQERIVNQRVDVVIHLGQHRRGMDSYARKFIDPQSSSDLLLARKGASHDE